MITYTTKHSTGLVKTRRSKGHTTPRYTEALWARWTGPKSASYRADGAWHCFSIATARTVDQSAAHFASAGNWEIERSPVEAREGR